MQLKRTVITAACALAMAVWCAPGAFAQPPANELTYLTFSGPVQIPGQTLPAGKSTVRLADAMTARSVVQILNPDGKQIAMFLTIPNERAEPTNETTVMFAETPADMPPAVKVWWYPGKRTGRQFVYPKEQAARIAKASGE